MGDSYGNRIYEVIDRADYSELGAIRVASENETQFGEVLTAGRTPIIELNSSYGTSVLRDLVTETGSGAVTNSTGSINVATGATASSTAQLTSAEIGRYIPGYGAQIGLGILIPTAATGEQQALWGGIGEDEDNGVYFGQDASGLFVAIEKGGVFVEKVYQADWNQDKLNGKGRSGYTLDVTEGVIFQIEFTWYGFGQILFGVVGIIQDSNGFERQHFIPCHSVKMDGVSLQTPNLRVFANVENGATAADYSLSVGGRQYSIVGTYIPKVRFCSEFRASTSTSTTRIPLVSFRRKSGFGDRSIKLQGFDAIVGSSPCLVQVVLDGTLTDATFDTPRGHAADEQALESDYQATAISGGTLIWQQLVAAGSNINKGVLAASNVDFDIPNGQTVSFCVRTVSSTGTIILTGRCTEEW